MTLGTERASTHRKNLDLVKKTQEWSHCPPKITYCYSLQCCRLPNTVADLGRGVATGWTGWTHPHHFFPEGVSGIELLWSVLISFRLYPQTIPSDLGRDTFPTTHHPYCPPHFV